MRGKPESMTRRKWVLRQLGTYWWFLMGLSGAAGWAHALMGEDQFLPWPVYPLGGALALWYAVIRLIEDATREIP